MKVKSLKKVKVTDEPVYDLTVPKYHNFLLKAGTFVHNSKDEADSFIGSIWLASKSKLSLQSRNSSADAKALTDTAFANIDEEAKMEEDFLGGKRVVNNLNDLANMIDDNGIIDIFGSDDKK